MFSRLHALLLAVAVAGCGGRSAPTAPAAVASGPAPAAPVAAADPVPPGLRLPTSVRPVGYRVTLELDPAARDFGGVIAIDIAVDAATDLIWLNADGLTIESAELEQGGARVALTTWAAPSDYLALRAPAPVAAGTGRLHLRYRGRVRPDDKGGMGLFVDGGERYLVTHFEPSDARRVFPSFDEPGHKVPWQLTLKVPAANLALTNTEEVGSRLEGAWKVVEFAPSRPLPSYLICIAVGPFEVVDAGRMRSGHPIRVLTPKGRVAAAAYATKVVGELQGLLEDYTGIGYPYGKMDHIAYPGPGGAMEHVGLITYGETALLMPEVERSARREYGIANIATHELAHQWFGNLVTPAWWDDLWLNESFASWAEGRIMSTWQPSWGVGLIQASSRNYALSSDAAASARKIHQPIASKHDIANAFDSITYSKGAAVLTMIEHWLGEPVFQKVVRAHLDRHRDGNATYADFAATLGEIAGPDAPKVLASFVDQPGAPRLEIDLQCDRGQPPRLSVAQSRFAPLGSRTPREGRWDLPVCVRWGQGKKTGRVCALLHDATETMALDGVRGCPDWVMPNAGGRGYYRAVPKGDLLARLTRHVAKLEPVERVTLAGDVEALVGSGDVAVGEALDLAAALARRTDRASLTSAAGLIYSIDGSVATADLPAWRAWVVRQLGAPARALGAAPKKGDSRDQRLLRPVLLKTVGTAGGDAAIVAEARTLTLRWLDDPKAIDGELLDTVLSVAAVSGDRGLWDRLVAAARSTTSIKQRTRILGLLAQFREPALVEASLDLALAKDLPPHETLSLVSRTAWRRSTAVHGFAFLKAHWDAVLARVPAEVGAGLVWVGTGTCDATLRAEVESFFRDRSATRLGGPRVFALALESMDACLAWDKANGAALSAYLAK